MFKQHFKYYKGRCPNPTYENVVDLKIGNFHQKVISKQPFVIKHKSFGLNEVSTWEVFEFKDNPGLIFIVNPFTNQGQQYWVERCLKDYTKKPNKLNLDPFNDLEPGEDWWQATQDNDKERAQRLLQKLRWATLGYHHNWNTKEYSEDARDDFPPELAELSRVIVQALYGPDGDTYQAEAAIINFYHLDSTLSGHKDVSEPNMDSPLLSISFGQSAVFLVGGNTLDDTVTAMFLHSGDIVIMSGAARSCYHGVPRIVRTSEKPWAGDGWEFTSCGRYLDSSRVNMNVRQVLLPGQTSVNT